MSDFEQWFNSEECPINPDGLRSEEIEAMRIAYNAAKQSMQDEAVAIPWMTNGLFIITFHDFVEYGRKSGGNIVNGMPWSFSFDGIPVTHETDTCYLLCRHPNDLRIKPNTVLIKFADGSYSVQDKDTTFKDYPFLRRIDAPQPSASAEIARLKSELEEARNDAERLNFMWDRKVTMYDKHPNYLPMAICFTGNDTNRHTIVRDNLRAAIDAAISKIGGGE